MLTIIKAKDITSKSDWETEDVTQQSKPHSAHSNLSPVVLPACCMHRSLCRISSGWAARFFILRLVQCRFSAQGLVWTFGVYLCWQKEDQSQQMSKMCGHCTMGPARYDQTKGSKSDFLKLAIILPCRDLGIQWDNCNEAWQSNERAVRPLDTFQTSQHSIEMIWTTLFGGKTEVSGLRYMWLTWGV